MARIPLVAGNWKMNCTIDESIVLLDAMKDDLVEIEGVEKLICPPFTALSTVASHLMGSGLAVGAQNIFWERTGAYTGEISPLMLQGLCTHVIIGHSERRAFFGETDETVNRRVLTALGHDLIPIICVGETLAQREAHQTHEVVSRQMEQAIEAVSTEKSDQIIVAYEPVWAIGTGKAATPADANGVISDSIRAILSDSFGEEITQAIRVLYGGSVKPENAREFFTQSEIDGALVGGASLKSESFIEIVRAACP
jgi:triosephosphate isomerase